MPDICRALDVSQPLINSTHDGSGIDDLTIQHHGGKQRLFCFQRLRQGDDTRDKIIVIGVRHAKRNACQFNREQLIFLRQRPVSPTVNGDKDWLRQHVRWLRSWRDRTFRTCACDVVKPRPSAREARYRHTELLVGIAFKMSAAENPKSRSFRYSTATLAASSPPRRIKEFSILIVVTHCRIRSRSNVATSAGIQIAFACLL